METRFEVLVKEDSAESHQLATILGEMLTSFFFRGDRGILKYYVNRLKDKGFDIVRHN